MYLNNKIIIEIDSRVRAPTDESQTSIDVVKDALYKELICDLGWEPFEEENEHFKLSVNVLRNELTK